MFLILHLDHSQEALEMARIQETTKQLEQQKKIKVNLHILLTKPVAPVPVLYQRLRQIYGDSEGLRKSLMKQ